MNILHRFVGNSGEKMAIEHIKSLGYKVLATNHRESFVEIDIIAEKENVVYIFEVKTRQLKKLEKRLNVSQRNAFTPEERVSRGKLEKMRRFADYYLNKNTNFSGISMGIITVVYVEDQKKPDIKIIEVF